MKNRVKFDRMFSRKCTILAAAAAVFGYGAASRAVTISEYYIDGQIATNSSFTNGLQNIDLSGSAPTVNLPSGDYFRFGVSLVVTNNPNPAAGDAWDLANQSVNGNPPQPQNLGISLVNLDISTSDPGGYSLAPVQGPSAGLIYSTPHYYSTAVINPSLVGSISNPGVIGLDNGTLSPIFASYAINPDSELGVNELAYFSGASATPSQATPFFTQLAYQSAAAGPVSLTTTIGANLSYWTNDYAGSVDSNGDPLFDASYPMQGVTASDAVNPLPILTVNVTPVQPFLALSSLAPTTYGNQAPLFFLGIRDVSYIAFEGLGRTFYIEVPHPSPAAASVTLFLQMGFPQPSRDYNALLTQLATDINNADDGVIASLSQPGFSSNLGYLYLTLPASDWSLADPNVFLDVDFTQEFNVAGASVQELWVLPEPASATLLLLGGTLLMSRRKHRPT